MVENCQRMHEKQTADSIDVERGTPNNYTVRASYLLVDSLCRGHTTLYQIISGLCRFPEVGGPVRFMLGFRRASQYRLLRGIIALSFDPDGNWGTLAKADRMSDTAEAPFRY